MWSPDRPLAKVKKKNKNGKMGKRRKGNKESGKNQKW